MSQKTALQELDDEIAEAMLDAGLAEAATHTSAGGGAATACTVVVDRNVELYAEGEVEVAIFRTLITIFRADVDAPARGDTVALTDAGESFALASLHRRDESRTVWIAAE